MKLDQADAVGAVVRDVLGVEAIGAYLHGSAVLGGLKPNRDIDVLAVSRRPTTAAEKRILIDRLTRISRRGDPAVRSIELEIVVHEQVRPWRYPAPVDFKYGDWLGPEFDRGDLTPWRTPDPDAALVLPAVLQADHPIFGPPPAEILDPIPAAHLRRALSRGQPALRTLGAVTGGALGGLDRDRHGAGR